MKNLWTGFHERVVYPNPSNMKVIFQKGPYSIGAHWHSEIEIIMPIAGDYKVTLDEKDYLMERGDIMFLHSGTIHSLYTPCDGSRIIFQFHIELLYTLKEFQNLLFTIPPHMLLKRAPENPTYRKAARLLTEILREERRHSLLWEAQVYALLLQLYTLLFRSHFIQMQSLPAGNGHLPFENYKQQEKFLAVCQYINQNLREPLSLESAAAYAGFSKFHFSRLFKDILGLTFSQYLTGQRIHKAKLLLLTTDASITDVAMESGFNSSSTFNRCFYSSESMSPTEFRRKNAGLRD